MSGVKHPELAKFHQEISSLKQEVQRSFSQLSHEQLNWKPNPKSWSIAECMAHLLKIFKIYRPQLQKYSSEAKKAFGKSEAERFKKTMMGRIFLNFVDANSKRKIPAPKMIHAQASDLHEDIVEDYLEMLQIVLDLMENLDGYDLNKMKVKHPISSLIRLNLRDYFDIESNHNRRHFKQMMRVLEHSNFPK